ncbi:unnamed protein product [Cunninghamella blakesleeana]
MLRTVLKRTQFTLLKKSDIATPAIITSFKTYSTNARVLEQQKRHVKVTTTSDKNTIYTLPYFWLRDHCRCSECYHSVTRQRLVNTFHIDRNIQPNAITPEKNGLNIVWQDGHSKLANTLTNKRTPLNFDDVINTDEALAEWLYRIEIDGLAFVDNVPSTLEDTEKLARRISFLRETHYSKGMWSFTADLAHADTAYTQLALGAHTDNTYFTEPSGLQMFHKLEFSGEGGDSLFVDGFAVASQLKEKHPEAYETLTKTLIPTHSAGDEDVLIVPTPRAYPILNHNSKGELFQIRYNNDDRSTLNHLSISEMEHFYDALFKWHKLLIEPKNEYWDPLPPGRVVTFDNWRILHGRSAFTGHRRICGAYFPWDDYKSRARTLRLSSKEKNFVL